MSEAKKIVTLGSWHKVIFLYGDRIPAPGESVSGNSYTTTAGGKGANQSAVCGLLGGNAVLIQNLGADEDGYAALQTFKDYNVNVEYVRLLKDQSTGYCCIMIDKNGENCLMTIAGAHGNYTPADIDACEEAFKDAYMVNFVLETNHEATFYGIQKAYNMGLKVFLDPAPAMPLPEDILSCLEWIKPNEHEASIITGIDVKDNETALEAANWFRDRGVKNVLITMGGDGCLLVTDEISKKYPAPKVKVVDTTTTGDTFAGAFLFALSVDMPMDDAIAYASCAGALCATKPGSIESSPRKEELDALYAEFRPTIQ